MTKTLSRADLAQFTGSEQWYRHGINRKVLFTDGAKVVADRAGAILVLAGGQRAALPGQHRTLALRLGPGRSEGRSLGRGAPQKWRAVHPPAARPRTPGPPATEAGLAEYSLPVRLGARWTDERRQRAQAGQDHQLHSALRKALEAVSRAEQQGYMESVKQS